MEGILLSGYNIISYNILNIHDPKYLHPLRYQNEKIKKEISTIDVDGQL